MQLLKINIYPYASLERGLGLEKTSQKEGLAELCLAGMRQQRSEL